MMSNQYADGGGVDWVAKYLHSVDGSADLVTADEYMDENPESRAAITAWMKAE